MKIWKPEDIRQLRDQLGLTRAAFGELVGVTGNYIYIMERGEKKPSKTLCLLLDCIEEKKTKTKRKGGKVYGKGNL